MRGRRTDTQAGKGHLDARLRVAPPKVFFQIQLNFFLNPRNIMSSPIPDSPKKEVDMTTKKEKEPRLEPWMQELCKASAEIAVFIRQYATAQTARTLWIGHVERKLKEKYGKDLSWELYGSWLDAMWEKNVSEEIVQEYERLQSLSMEELLEEKMALYGMK